MYGAIWGIGGLAYSGLVPDHLAGDIAVLNRYKIASREKGMIARAASNGVALNFSHKWNSIYYKFKIMCFDLLILSIYK